MEKVDGEPSHGEVPGTDAYRQREEDAAPDEIAIIKEGEPAGDNGAAASADEQPVPKTVVEESPGPVGAHSEEFLEKRKADAEADEVVKADETQAREDGNTGRT